MTPSALIADDEPLLANDLRARLGRLWPELSTSVCHSGVDALERLQADKPEIAFLDIRMPGLTGLEVAARLDFPCHVVFVTAYDQYAVEAFERAAVDYVLKPIGDERLGVTVARLKHALGEGAAQSAQLAGLLQELLRQDEAAVRSAPLKWIRASVGDAVKLVSVDDVVYFQAADKYTLVFTATAELLIRTPIKELTVQLDAEQFWQIHRGTIVNVRHMASVRHDENARMLLTLRERPEQLVVSRSYAHLFRQM